MTKNTPFKAVFEQAIFRCCFCDYVSGRKYDMKRHTLTKHVRDETLCSDSTSKIAQITCHQLPVETKTNKKKTQNTQKIEKMRNTIPSDELTSQFEDSKTYIKNVSDNIIKNEEGQCVKDYDITTTHLYNLKIKFDNSTYTCHVCNYKTHKKYNYDRHCETNRHIQRMTKDKRCKVCNRVFKNLAGLKSHISMMHVPEIPVKNTHNLDIDKDDHINNNTEIDEFKSIIVKIMQENHDIQENLIKENRDLQKKLIEIAKEPRIINQTNNNQKTFNFIQFLNQECKDAMNLTDFVNNLVITFEDLEKIEEHGYFSGIKDSLIQSIQQMDKNKRPIHCTDTKRKHFYIKDENVWNRDNGSVRIDNAVNQFNTNQLKTLHTWQQDNPNYLHQQDKQEKVNKVMKEITCLYTDDETGNRVRKKILNELCQATFIDK